MDVTIYTFSDVSILGLILNGVAAWCANSNSFFEIAILASMIHLLKHGPSVVLAASQNATRQAISGVVIALCLAMVLTTGGFKSKVTLENPLTGQVIQVANVPMVISVIPAVASTLANNLGQQMETVFGGASAEYSAISVNNNGFINPLKMILQTRSLVNRAGLSTSIHAVTSSCLGVDSGIDFLNTAQLIANAGASNGQTAATSSSVLSVNQNTTIPTGIGALLYAASLNTTGTVPDLNIPNTDIASCKQAATYVANQLNAFFQSADFLAAMQGVTNGTDAPNLKNMGTYADLVLSYQAMSNLNANIDNNTSTVEGVSQANAEMTNLIMSQVVQDNLGCLQTFGSQKAACLAEKSQEAAIEQSNIDNAASANAALNYMGQFSNMMLSLIIGLGPVIVIFMMFSGVGSGRNIKIALHMIVWPLLVYNVGAVLVNGIIYNQVSIMLQSLRGASGILTQVQTWNAYRAFSIQIGSASSIMAAIPVLMTTIFALGESAAAVSIAGTMSGKDRFNEGDVASGVTSNQNALTSVRPGDSATVGAGMRTSNWMGQLDAFSMNGKASNAKKTANDYSEAVDNAFNVSSGRIASSDFSKQLTNGKFNDLSNDKQVSQAVKQSYDNNLKWAKDYVAGLSMQQVAEISNSDSVGIKGSAGGKGSPSGKGKGLPGIMGLAADATIKGTDSKRGQDEQSMRENAAESIAAARTYTENKQAVDRVMSGEKSGTNWGETSKYLTSFDKSIKEAKSQKDLFSDTHSKGQELVSNMGNISPENLVRGLQDANVGRFINGQHMSGGNFSTQEGKDQFEAYRKQFNEQFGQRYASLGAGNTDVLARVAAMDRMARDSSVSDVTGTEAARSVLGLYSMLTNSNLGIPSEQPQDLGVVIPKPENQTKIQDPDSFVNDVNANVNKTINSPVSKQVDNALKPYTGYAQGINNLIDKNVGNPSQGPKALVGKMNNVIDQVVVAKKDKYETLNNDPAVRAVNAAMQIIGQAMGVDQDPTKIQKENPVLPTDSPGKKTWDRVMMRREKN